MLNRRTFSSSVALAAVAAGTQQAHAAATVGQAAPDFTATDAMGKTHKLSDFKGKQEQLDIHQVTWELEDMSSTRIGMSTFRKLNVDGNDLVLTYRGQTYNINEQNCKLLLGRDDACHIIVKSDFASRQHANIELRFGNFILNDHSNNGTYIRSNEGVVARLNHKDTILHGKGSISLGQPYSDNPADLIEFDTTIKS